MLVSEQERYLEKSAKPKHAEQFVEQSLDLQWVMKIDLAGVPEKLRFETEHKKANSSPLGLGD
tara:strand:- start:1254 stop:1442 length:189 start_codon:yes stop_codon:yes gene_type:complete